jgi:hypothetical protein
MRFDHIVINDYPPFVDGPFWRTFDVDGTNIATQGTQGVRDVSLTDCWLYRATDAIVMVRNSPTSFCTASWTSGFINGVTDTRTAESRSSAMPTTS